jgi:hypothetical protein
MLGASICVFALVSAFVAFGSWPGSASQTEVNQIVLRSVQRPHSSKVTVRSNAVALARRQAQRAARTVAAVSSGQAVVPLARVPGAPAAQAAPRQVASAPSAGTRSAAPSPAPDVTKTAQQITTQVNQTAGQVQQQVNQVVDQVIGGPQTGGSDTAVQQVQQAAGGLLGH